MTDLQNIGNLFRVELRKDISSTSLDIEIDRTVFTVYQGDYSIAFTFDRDGRLVSFKIEEV
jgi:hypothetical protein